METDEKQWHVLAQAYQKRWDPILSVKGRLDAYLWEGEAVLTPEVVAKVRKINSILGDLLWAIEEQLEAKNPANRPAVLSSTEVNKDEMELRKERRRILTQRKKTDDSFGKEVQDIIDEIAADLRPYIRG